MGCRGRCRVGVEVWCRGVEARAQPLLSRLLPPLGATPPSSRRILAPRVLEIVCVVEFYQKLSSQDDSSDTPLRIICRQVHVVAQAHSRFSNTSTSTDDVGAGRWGPLRVHRDSWRRDC